MIYAISIGLALLGWTFCLIGFMLVGFNIFIANAPDPYIWFSAALSQGLGVLVFWNGVRLWP